MMNTIKFFIIGGGGIKELYPTLPNTCLLLFLRNFFVVKVNVSKDDVELIMTEMELNKDRADRCLREHGGDVVAALSALVNG